MKDSRVFDEIKMVSVGIACCSKGTRRRYSGKVARYYAFGVLKCAQASHSNHGVDKVVERESRLRRAPTNITIYKEKLFMRRNTMKKFAAFILFAMCLFQATGAFAAIWAYPYGGTLSKDGIATTSEKKKTWPVDHAFAAVASKSPSYAQVGYNMWYTNKTNYVTNPTIVSSTKDFEIVYKTGHGKEGRWYGLAVKNHKDNGTSITVHGSFEP